MLEKLLLVSKRVCVLQSCDLWLYAFANIYFFKQPVRCSAFPVVSRPLTTSLRWFLSRCLSLETIAAPSDTPGVLISMPFSVPSNVKGRRYQGIQIQTGSMLIVVSLCFAVAAAWVVNGNSVVYLNSYCLSVVSHLMITCLDGKSHELNPLRYQHTNMLASLTFAQIKAYLLSVAVSAIMVSVAIFFQNLPSDEIPWGTIGYSLAVAIATTLYLSVSDFMARTFLCSSRCSLQRLIYEVTSDVSPDLATQVIVKAALFGDNALFDSIMKPTAKVGTNSLEEEELGRSKTDADKLASVLTTKSADFGLPEDMLRVLILESFGGRESTSVGASGHHATAVKMLVSGSVNTGRLEPPAVPVVRALCAYVAGLGVALQKVSKPRNPKLPPLATPATFATWALPPGAISCSERALVGATRMIIQSITGPSSTNWRDTHLSMFVPVLLMAAFQLRCGIESHEKDLGHSAHSPLLQVKQTCDACAVFLVKTLQATDSRIVELTIQQQDCRRWLGTLLDQSVGPAGTPPVLILENDKPLASYNKRGFSIKYY
jgi:hypothetical protein